MDLCIVLKQGLSAGLLRQATYTTARLGSFRYIFPYYLSWYGICVFEVCSRYLSFFTMFGAWIRTCYWQTQNLQILYKHNYFRSKSDDWASPSVSGQFVSLNLLVKINYWKFKSTPSNLLQQPSLIPLVTFYLKKTFYSNLNWNIVIWGSEIFYMFKKTFDCKLAIPQWFCSACTVFALLFVWEFIIKT